MSRRPSVLATIALSTLALTACQERYPPMPEVWANPAIPPHQQRANLPEPSHEGISPDGSLLQSYADRKPRSDEEVAGFKLTQNAKTLVAELLIAAAKDDPELMKRLIADNSRWGLPDRRELRARPIVSDDDPHGIEFMTALRNAASRFGKRATFNCEMLQPGWDVYAATGAEPVWCLYNSKDGVDILAFRVIVHGGQVKADYVGLFPERPTTAMRVVGAGDPPPLTPYVKRPVVLTAPELMPNGSNPVLDKPKR